MSKFDKVFKAREDSAKENLGSGGKKDTDGKPKAIKPSKGKTTTAAKKNDGETAVLNLESSTAEETSGIAKQRGRPKAKRSDPAFIGFTTYIRKDTHLKVKIALLQEGKGREMSELVEDLLSGWTKNK